MSRAGREARYIPLVMRIRLLVGLFLLAPLGLDAQGGSAAFTLRPGDLVELQVLRDTTLSGRFAVDERGRAVLPILGPRVVTGGPWPAVRDSILAVLSREIADPAIRLTPYRRVFVLGFVQEPGAYFADPTTSIAGAIALAGGASSDGDLTRLRVLRDGGALFDRVGIEDARVAADVQSGDQIFVDRRGWFDRNASFFVSGLVGLAGIVVTLIVAR